jgi:hypothetical protein
VVWGSWSTSTTRVCSCDLGASVLSPFRAHPASARVSTSTRKTRTLFLYPMASSLGACDADYETSWTAAGTHSGSWGALEPTGRRATFSAVNIFRFDHGKVVEIWNHRDDLGLREQLGVAIYAGPRREDWAASNLEDKLRKVWAE